MPPARVVFSLDLRNGAPLGAWGVDDPLVIANHAVDAGAGRILILDLAVVGTNSGTTTEALLHAIRGLHPHVELSCGGGVRGVGDLRRAAARGVDAVLVASALHDGRIGREECRRIDGGTSG
jgi:phosphoribosylformimino-5-aminoimidazole carboxamide ribotide isomerase